MQKVIYCLCILFFSIIIFVIGMAVGARLAYDGELGIPPYYYEKLENDISQIEVILDSGEIIYFDRNEDKNENN